MSHPAEADAETVRAVLMAHAHCEMAEQSADKQTGVAGGDQVDLAFEALDRLLADALNEGGGA